MTVEELDHEQFMREAINEAKKGYELGQVPIGSVIVCDGQVISRGYSLQLGARSRLRHAEMEALERIQPFLYERARECVIYTTMEPCPMCLGAIVMTNIRAVVFGSYDLHAGAGCIIEPHPYIRARIQHYIGGVLREECELLYRAYRPEFAKVLFGS